MTVQNDRDAGVKNFTPEPAHVERTVIAEQRHVTLTGVGHVDRTTGEILDTKPITGMDGKTYNRPAPKPQEETKPRRRPITDASNDAAWELRRAIEKIIRITNDDRYNRNKNEVDAHMRGHLIYAVEACQDLLDQMPTP